MCRGALRKFAAGTTADGAAIAAAGAIPLLVELLSGGSHEGRAKAALALWNLAFGTAADMANVVAEEAWSCCAAMARSRGKRAPIVRCLTCLGH
jgi:hypothetical protein